MTEDRQHRKGRDPRPDFSEVADRMQRSRRRFMVAWYLTIIVTVTTTLWLLLHPEAIGSFLGRVATGFHAGAR